VVKPRCRSHLQKYGSALGNQLLVDAAKYQDDDRFVFSNLVLRTNEMYNQCLMARHTLQVGDKVYNITTPNSIRSRVNYNA
jgi:endo-1,4-beta-mannosidase